MLRTQLEASCAIQQIKVASGEQATVFQRLHERWRQPPSPAAPVSPTALGAGLPTSPLRVPLTNRGCTDSNHDVIRMVVSST